MTPADRRYKALVDRYHTVEVSPSRYADLLASELFGCDPLHPLALVQAPLAYPLHATPGLEVRARPFLVLTLFKEGGRYLYRFNARVDIDVVPT
jgi:hypothetical protein